LAILDRDRVDIKFSLLLYWRKGFWGFTLELNTPSNSWEFSEASLFSPYKLNLWGEGGVLLKSNSQVSSIEYKIEKIKDI
jgi:hypothetical protein